MLTRDRPGMRLTVAAETLRAAGWTLITVRPDLVTGRVDEPGGDRVGLAFLTALGSSITLLRLMPGERLELLRWEPGQHVDHAYRPYTVAQAVSRAERLAVELGHPGPGHDTD